MIFEDVRGQDHAIGILRRALGRGRLAHAWIFAGPGGVGKRSTARALTSALLCRQAPGEGCGSCEDCHLVATGAHPDLVVEDLARAREDRSTATRVSIEQIRRARSQLAMHAVRGKRKVGLVDQAELLTIDAQNALLKTLEEPPGETTLVLICTSPDALLSTIRSRCQCLRFAPLETPLVEELLKAEGVEPPTAATAAALADGSLDRARSLTDEEGLAWAEELRTRLDAIARTPVPQLLDLAAELSGPRGEKGRARQELNRTTVLTWCRERLLAEAGDQPAPNTEEAAQWITSIEKTLRRSEQAYATVRELDRNANTNLAWDRLILGLRAAR